MDRDDLSIALREPLSKKMNYFTRLFILMATFAASFCSAQEILAGHRQLLVVAADGWDGMQGTLQLYQRSGDASAWTSFGKAIPVVLGQRGLAWGIGLHPKSTEVPYKAEGDQKSPAGIFSLGTAFGFASNSEMAHLKIDYLALDSYTEAVDDPRSRYYNCIVNSQTISPDWNSSEKMGAEPLYEIGFVVNHNFPSPQPGSGSAIFFHIWRNEQSGTAGCTAMAHEDLAAILTWLDSSENPVLVQLPRQAYDRLQSEWNLPSLP